MVFLSHPGTHPTNPKKHLNEWERIVLTTTVMYDIFPVPVVSIRPPILISLRFKRTYPCMDANGSRASSSSHILLYPILCMLFSPQSEELSADTGNTLTPRPPFHHSILHPHPGLNITHTLCHINGIFNGLSHVKAGATFSVLILTDRML